MIKLSWKDVEKTTDKLAKKIKASGFKPDYIIGITTGGLIPLSLLAKRLKIKRILTVSASISKKDKKLKIIYAPDIDLKSKKVLLIDEIVETGTTLKKISEMFTKKFNIGELKTATLGMNKDRGTFHPDYYIFEEKGEWVVFPWEDEEKFTKYNF